MRLVSLLIPLTLVLVLYAAFVKLAARLRRARVGWGPGFAFGGGTFAFALLGRMLALPFLVGVLLSLAFQLFAGGWFFSTRARTPEGEPLGMRAAVEMQMLTSVLFMGTALALSALVRMMTARMGS